MGTLELIFKIAGYAMALTLILRSSFFFIFYLASQPAAWIAFIAAFGALNMLGAFWLDFNARLVATATLLAIIFGFPAGPRGASRQETKELRNAMYEGAGISNGSVKRLIGYLAFSVVSIVIYALAFGEICNSDGGCTPLYRSLF